jgi:hypothetical protein
VCGDKLKKEWRKGRKGEGKTENLDRDKKGKDGFQRWRGEVDAQALLRYTRNRSNSRGVRKRTEQTRFRWQWSECFREDERDRKTNTE